MAARGQPGGLAPLPRVLAALAVLMAAGCGERDTDPGPGGVSVGEARALDQAASMLDQQRLPAEALASGAPSPQPSPAASPATEVPKT